MVRMPGFVVLLSVMCVAGLAQAQEAVTGFDLSASDIAELEAGETLVTGEPGDINRGQVIGIVDAPLRPLMEIITDTNNQYIWFPDMLESEMLTRTERTGRSRGVTNMPWPISNRNYQVDGEYNTYTFDGVECHAIEYQYVPNSGNMDALFGYYLLCPYNGSTERTIMKYVINADVGVWLPASVISWAQRRMLPGIVEGLRERYEVVH